MVYHAGKIIPLKNKDGGILLFDKLTKADEYANKRKDTDQLRVISIEGIHE